MLNLVGALGLVVVLVIMAMWVWSMWGSTSKVGQTDAGKMVTKAIDTSEGLVAYGHLTWIRQLDSVESDPKAVDYCNYLRNLVTAWKRPVVENPADEAVVVSAKAATVKAKTPAGKTVTVLVSSVKGVAT